MTLPLTKEEIDEAVAKKLYGSEWGTWCAKRYSTSISAAWEIMEAEKRISLVPTDKGWHASACEGQATEGECIELWYPTACMTRNQCGCGYCTVADTAPMAICLAYLKLNER